MWSPFNSRDFARLCPFGQERYYGFETCKVSASLTANVKDFVRHSASLRPNLRRSDSVICDCPRFSPSLDFYCDYDPGAVTPIARYHWDCDCDYALHRSSPP